MDNIDKSDTSSEVELKKEIEELRNELEDIKAELGNKEEDSGKENSKMGRRKFLKVLGGSALGLGAAAAMPAAAFNIRSERGIKYFNGSAGNPEFSVDSEGLVDTNVVKASDFNLESNETGSAGFRIEEQDLSNLSLGLDYHNYIFHHDGTGEITLSDSSSTTSSGLYLWDSNNSAWVPTQEDAITLGGYSADQFAKVSGDTFNGTLSVQSGAGNSLMQILTSSSSSDEPRFHMGGDQTRGGRMVFHPDTGNFELGYYSSNTFSPIMRWDENNNPLELLSSDVHAKNMEIESDTESTDVTIKNRGSGDQDVFLYLDYDGTGETGMRIQKNDATLWRLETGEAFGQDLHFREEGNSPSHLELEKGGDVVFNKTVNMEDNYIFNTDYIDFDESSRDTAHKALKFGVKTNNEIEQTYESVTGASTSAKSIATVSKGGFILVYGESGSDSNVYFQDVLVAVDSGGVNRISNQESGSPAGRTYNMNGSTLELTMSSGTYNVTKLLFNMSTSV